MEPPIHRRAFAAGLGALAAGCAVRGPFLVNIAAPPPAADEGDRGARLSTGSDTAGRMTAPVRINGAGPFDFVVDTGANRTVIATELAAQLGLPSAGPAQIHGIAGVEPAQTATIGLLQVDAVTSRALRAPTLPRARLGTDGLLGVDVLRNRRVLLDFRRSLFRIAPSGAAEPSAFAMLQAATTRLEGLGPGVVVPARYRFGQLIIVDADVVGHKVTAFLDSGAQSTVGNLRLRGLVAEPQGSLGRPRFETPLFSATGQTATGEVATLPLLRIGGLRISRLTAAFSDLHVFDIWGLATTPSLLLGVDVMGQFAAIELDYGRRLVTFYPRSLSSP